MLHISESDVEARLDWNLMVEALREGHLRDPGQMDDLFLVRGNDTLLNRAAWIPGLGMCLKTVTVMQGNKARGIPSVQGVLVLFDEDTGSPIATIDSALVTRWKTAADSALGAKLLARLESRKMLIVGAGEVAASLAEAYAAVFPNLQEIGIWNRTVSNAADLAAKLTKRGLQASVCEDLESGAGEADIIACATMTRDPILKGAWVGEGTHVDLVGAFRSDMREGDDELLRKSRLFVDSRGSTVSHIGELCIPIAEGVIAPKDILGDLYQLCAGSVGRNSPDEITLFKNGGGAHLDLMTANMIVNAYRAG